MKLGKHEFTIATEALKKSDFLKYRVDIYSKRRIYEIRSEGTGESKE